MRQIVLDTETTGLEPEKGHRIIEIGCIELVDRKVTGNTFHKYINPGRDIEDDAVSIHGITTAFLKDKPTFDTILEEFLVFINGAELIAHNAGFDVNFINYEIKLLSKNPRLLDSYVTVFDTLGLARKMFPGQRNTLDAICKRYKIDLSERKFHGALLDAQLLAEAYLLMTGGQGSLFSNIDFGSSDVDLPESPSRSNKGKRKSTMVTSLDDNEINAHQEFLASIKKLSGKCLWDS
jgi:DNA polymerase III subunit epsilon